MKVLPDSSGRPLYLVHHYELDYDGATGTFIIDDVVTGASSNVSAVVNRVITTDSQSGTLILTLALADQDSDAVFTNDEDLKVGGVVIAKANGVGTCTYQQSIAITSGDNPARAAIVDSQGAVRTTYPEGPIEFSAFGAARVSSKALIKNYDFTYDDLENDFYISSSAGASQSLVSASHAILFSNPTTSGSITKRTSHLYHKLPTGNGNLSIFGVLVGDMGKAGVQRCWGMFDNDNGLFFQLSGSSMSVVVRSNTTGTVVDTVISQSAWNKDVATGTQSAFNKSGITLNPSKPTMYWIDYKLTAGGSVRFGSYKGAERIVFHEHTCEDCTDTMIGKQALPVRVEQENLDTSVSTSELRLYGASVSAEDEFHPEHFASPFSITKENTVVTNDLTSILTIKPSLTHKGFDNKIVALLKRIVVSAVDNSDGITPERVRVIFFTRPILSGSTYTAVPVPYGRSSMQADTAGVLSSSFLPLESVFRTGQWTVVGDSEIDVESFTSYHGANLLVMADGTVNPLNLSMQTTRTNATASVDLTLAWSEISD